MAIFYLLQFKHLVGDYFLHEVVYLKLYLAKGRQKLQEQYSFNIITHKFFFNLIKDTILCKKQGYLKYMVKMGIKRQKHIIHKLFQTMCKTH